MKGVNMTRFTYRLYAQCLEPGCTFERQATTGLKTVTVRADCERHAQQTGHTVHADILDRTAYSPEMTP